MESVKTEWNWFKTGIENLIILLRIYFNISFYLINLFFFNLIEEGKYLALDLGGTNFRVLLIDLHGFDFQMDNEVYSVPQEIMRGTGEMVIEFEIWIIFEIIFSN